MPCPLSGGKLFVIFAPWTIPSVVIVRLPRRCSEATQEVQYGNSAMFRFLEHFVWF
jgi:hypothetical protein